MASSPMQMLVSQAHGALQRGDVALAVKLSRQAVAQEPRNPGLNHLAGIAAFHNQDLGAAMKYLRKAAEYRPPLPGVLSDLGQVLRAAGRIDDAVKAFREAVKAFPADADCWDGLGNLLAETGRLEEAVTTFRQAVSLAPGNARILSNMGSVLARAGQTDAARQTLQQALHLAPAFVDAKVNLATLEAEEGDAALALQLADSVLTHQPAHRGALLARARAIQSQGDLAGAEDVIRGMLAAAPNDPQLLLSLASILADRNKNAEAMAAYERSLAGQRANPKALTGMARQYIAAGRFDEGRALLHEAIALSPDWYPSRMELALMELSLWRFEQAFPHYGWRVHQGRGGRPTFPQPQWDGVTRPGQKLLVWGEQGIGDEVLWLTLAPDLLAAGMELVIQAQSRLVSLLQRSFPTAKVVATGHPPAPECLNPKLVQISSAELFRYVPASGCKGGYLKPDPGRVAALRAQLLDKSGGKPLVGVSWRSSAEIGGPQKSCQLRHWGPLLRRQDVAFVSLQYGDVADDLRAAHEATGINILQADGVDVTNDLDGFAALVAALDKVVSTSNTTVHFAGALGIETHVMLPRARGRLWYYGTTEQDSRWYASVRIHRQIQDGTWDGLLESVCDAALGPL